ncbi:Cof-type HAD-IIB family hydrolase [Cohnella ginsengisoli]|uniref:Cof-type HAD-IIB family hydrolase n=1 Tax=Cohnella ginsengisoli TaxID=425004 RepID=A0A9X4QMF0_9BACL|nr:Cof-type HAD-IIB family hydrolase [Cohnella ginsengisoli]MDG0791643.1 Cof-type HAD-IIB family hydrolase [Cohnella ginsengisoli]
MSSYRLIAIDLDDTLLNDQLEVTEGTKNALAQAMSQGVHVTLATGRMFASAKQTAAQVGLNVPLITYQGSLVRNLLDERTLYERSVDLEAVRKLYGFTRARKLHLQTYIDDKLYSFDDGDRLAAYAKQSNIPYIVEPELDALPAGHHTKLIIIDEPALLDEIAPELHALLGPGVHITKSKPHYLEFTHGEGTKGHALRFLAEHYGLTMDQTIAIGDSWNDREMIEAAGLGVAMANAVPALREIADYVTASNNEDGVKQVVEKFILNA